jgi:hypothetical protein
METWKVGGDVLEGFMIGQVNGFDLQSLHEAFRLGVAVGVAATAHRTDQAVGVEQRTVDFGRMLGGLKRSSQHLDEGGCGGHSERALGLGRSGRVAFARAAGGSAARGSAAVLGGSCGGAVE